MKSEYDFSTMKSRKNPYAAKLKRPVIMRSDLTLHINAKEEDVKRKARPHLFPFQDDICP